MSILKEYNEFVRDTCRQEGPHMADEADLKIYGAVFELMGEAGEVMEILQKASRKRGGVLSFNDVVNLRDEIGDVLWAVQAVCRALKYPLEMCMADNMQKLTERNNNN